MQKSYEAPELTLVGSATDIVLGVFPTGPDGDDTTSSWDFEFEQD